MEIGRASERTEEAALQPVRSQLKWKFDCYTAANNLVTSKVMPITRGHPTHGLYDQKSVCVKFQIIAKTMIKGMANRGPRQADLGDEGVVSSENRIARITEFLSAMPMCLEPDRTKPKRPIPCPCP